MKRTLRVILAALILGGFSYVLMAVVVHLAEANGVPKVVICHPPDTLEIAAPAAEAHLENHEADYLGPCEEPEPTDTPDPPTPTPTEPTPTETPLPTETQPTPTPAPDSTPSPTPTESPTATLEQDGSHWDTHLVVVPRMWLLIGSGGLECYIISELPPSILRQNQICFPDFDLTWHAVSAPCAGPVLDDGSEFGFWKCDELLTYTRQPLAGLAQAYERHLARGNQ